MKPHIWRAKMIKKCRECQYWEQWEDDPNLGDCANLRVNNIISAIDFRHGMITQGNNWCRFFDPITEKKDE